MLLADFQYNSRYIFSSQQSSLWYDDNYIKNYVPGHVNFGISVIGLTGGIVYYEMRKRKIDVNEYLVSLLMNQLFFIHE